MCIRKGINNRRRVRDVVAECNQVQFKYIKCWNRSFSKIIIALNCKSKASIFSSFSLPCSMWLWLVGYRITFYFPFFFFFFIFTADILYTWRYVLQWACLITWSFFSIITLFLNFLFLLRRIVSLLHSVSTWIAIVFFCSCLIEHC